MTSPIDPSGTPRDEQAPCPDDLIHLSRALDELGRLERDAAPAGLEQRVFFATAPARSNATLVVRAWSPRLSARGGLALAASIVLLGAAGAVWFAGHTPSTSTPTSATLAPTDTHDENEWIEFETRFASHLDLELDAIEAEASALELDLGSAIWSLEEGSL